MALTWGAVWDALGWLGAALVLVPYALVSTGRMSGTSAAYRGLNIGGGLCLLANTFYHGAYPSAVVNVIWTAIAVYAITRRAGSRTSR